MASGKITLAEIIELEALNWSDKYKLNIEAAIALNNQFKDSAKSLFENANKLGDVTNSKDLIEEGKKQVDLIKQLNNALKEEKKLLDNLTPAKVKDIAAAKQALDLQIKQEKLIQQRLKSDREQLRLEKEKLTAKGKEITSEKQSLALRIQQERLIQQRIKSDREQLRLKAAEEAQAKKNRVLTREEIAEKIKAQEAQKEQNKQIRAAAREELGLNDAYKKLEIQRNTAQRNLKTLLARRIELNNATNKNSSAIRKNNIAISKASAEFKKYNARLSKVDRKTKEFTRSIGNYRQALGGLRGTLLTVISALGVYSGIHAFVRVIQNGINAVRSFSASMATLSGILGTTRAELQDVEESIIKVAGASVNTATDVAKTAVALATLGKTKDEIKDLLSPVNNLAIGLETTTAEAGKFLIGTLNAFVTSTKHADDFAQTIAKIRSSTTLDFQKMVDGFQYINPLAQILGDDLAFVGSVIGILSDNSIKAQRAGRLLATAIQKLGKNNLSLEQALLRINRAQESGIEGIQIQTLATELFGSKAAALGIILANNFNAIEKNAQAYRDNGGALDYLVNEQLTSLDASLRILRSRWEEYILNTDKATGFSFKLRDAINFLANNLSRIISTLITLVSVYAGYRTAVFLSRIQTQYFTISIKNLTIGFKNLNRVLKANIFGAIAAAVIGLIALFRGTKKSLIETAQETTQASKEFLQQSKKITSLNKELKTLADRHDKLKENLAKGEKNTEQYNKDLTEFNKINDKLIKTVPKSATAIDEQTKSLIANTGIIREYIKERERLNNIGLELDLKKLEGTLEKSKKQLESFKGVFEIEGLGTFQEIDGVYTKIISNARERVNTYRKATDEEILKIIESYKALGDSILETTTSIQATQKALEPSIEPKTINQIREEIELLKTELQGLEIDSLINNEPELALNIERQIKEKTKLLKQNQELLNVISGNEITNAEKSITELINDLAQLETEKANLEKQRDDNININNKADLADANEAIKEKGKEIIALDEKIKRLQGIEDDANKKKLKEIADRAKELRNIRFKIDKIAIDEEIKTAKEIADNDKNSFEDRFHALEEAANKERDLAFLKNKLEEENAKGQKEKLLLIEEQYRAKLREIKNKYNQEELDLENEKADAIFNLAATELAGLIEANDRTYSNETKTLDERFDALNDYRDHKIELLEQQYNKEIAAAGNNTLKLEEINERYTSGRLKLEAEVDEKRLELINEGDKKVAEIRGKLEKELADVTIGFINQIADQKVAAIDRELEKSQTRYDRLIEQAQGDDERVKLLQRKKAKDEDRLEKEKIKAQRKQALFNKAVSLTNVFISIAEGVAKYSANPFTLPLVPLVKAIGAVQIAAILATPIPKYARGRGRKSKDEIAYTGDAGIHEVVEKANNKDYITRNKPTLTYLEKDDIVHSSIDAYIASKNRKNLNQNDIYKATVRANLNAQSQKVDKYQEAIIINNSINEMILEKAILQSGKSIEKNVLKAINKSVLGAKTIHNINVVQEDPWIRG